MEHMVVEYDDLFHNQDHLENLLMGDIFVNLQLTPSICLLKARKTCPKGKRYTPVI